LLSVFWQVRRLYMSSPVKTQEGFGYFILAVGVMLTACGWYAFLLLLVGILIVISVLDVGT
jgi:hypothetical protein